MLTPIDLVSETANPGVSYMASDEQRSSQPITEESRGRRRRRKSNKKAAMEEEGTGTDIK